MLCTTVSPSRTYVALCCGTNFESHYLREFYLPECYTNDSQAAAHYFLNKVDFGPAIEGCISKEAYDSIKIAPNSILQFKKKAIPEPVMTRTYGVWSSTESAWTIRFDASKPDVEFIKKFGVVEWLHHDAWQLVVDSRYDFKAVLNFMQTFQGGVTPNKKMRFWYHTLSAIMVVSAETREDAARMANLELGRRGRHLPEPIKPEDMDELDSVDPEVFMISFETDEEEDD